MGTQPLTVALVVEMLATIKRLHMGAGDQGYRMRGCQVCRLVSDVEAAMVGYLPPQPPPLPPPRPRLRSVPVVEVDDD